MFSGRMFITCPGGGGRRVLVRGEAGLYSMVNLRLDRRLNMTFSLRSVTTERPLAALALVGCLLICCKSLMVDAGEDNRPDGKDHYKPGMNSTGFRD